MVHVQDDIPNNQYLSYAEYDNPCNQESVREPDDSMHTQECCAWRCLAPVWCLLPHGKMHNCQYPHYQGNRSPVGSVPDGSSGIRYMSALGRAAHDSWCMPQSVYGSGDSNYISDQHACPDDQRTPQFAGDDRGNMSFLSQD